MKKVAFITPECFLDVDMPVVKELNKHVDLLWVVTFSVSAKNNQHVFSPGQIAEYSRLNNISHINILCTYRVRDPRRIIISMDILGKIKKFSPDVTYFNSFYDPYLAVLSSLIIGRRRTVIGVHDIELHPGSDSFLHKASNWIIMNLFKNYHLYSASQLGLFNVLHPGKKTFLIGLFLKDFGKPREAAVSKKDKKVNFLFFGTDYPYKGLDVLIKAVNLLSQRTRDFIITVAGKSEKFDRFSGFIADKSIFDLHLGFIKSEDIPVFFNNADFIILPYNQVTQCGPLLVAFNYNLPVIASDLPYFRELIEDLETGYLFNSGDPYQLSEIMYIIIENHNSDVSKIRYKLSEFVSKNYKIENFIRKYLEMFSSVAK